MLNNNSLINIYEYVCAQNLTYSYLIVLKAVNSKL